jgi:hypothetical protein
MRQGLEGHALGRSSTLRVGKINQQPWIELNSQLPNPHKLTAIGVPDVGHNNQNGAY